MRYLALFILSISLAQAAVNLPLTCKKPGVTGSQVCDRDLRVFEIPNAASMVSTSSGWQRFDNLQSGTMLACTNDIPAGSSTDVCPASAKVQMPYCEVAGAVCASDDQDNPGDPIEPPGKNTITLRWIAPTTNENNTPLTDLSGFRIYSGTTNNDGSDPTAGQLSVLKTITLVEAKTCANNTEQYCETLPDYGWGKFYFAMTAYTAKAESVRSNILMAEFKEPATRPGPVTGLSVEVTFTTVP